jgi:hypothetical protein
MWPQWMVRSERRVVAVSPAPDATDRMALADAHPIRLGLQEMIGGLRSRPTWWLHLSCGREEIFADVGNLAVVRKLC